MNPELITTSDGSHSLHVREINETYHSTHGALRESLHVFIRAGFDLFRDSLSIRVVEVGMGTGLNVLLTLLETEELKVKTHYTAIEAYPLPATVTSALNYPNLLQSKNAGVWFQKIHSASWGTDVQITDSFVLNKINTKVQSVLLATGIDIVYFDAFAPQKQPEMWTVDVFGKIFNSMSDGGVLVTYCAKGQVKRDLRSVGFEVESLPGPPGKREMIRARKKNQIDPK